MSAQEIAPQFYTRYALLRDTDGNPIERGASALPFRRDLSRLLIVHKGRFIGWRKWVGGRQFCWQRPNGSEEFFDYHQFSMPHEDALHAAICIFGDPLMLFVGGNPAMPRADSGVDIRVPFNKFGLIDGEDLPQFSRRQPL